MKSAHVAKIERRLDVAVSTLLPEITSRGEVDNPVNRLAKLLARVDSTEYEGRSRPEIGWRSAARDIITLLETDVPELCAAVRSFQGGQVKSCRYCGEKRLGLIVASPDDKFTWECRDEDGCEIRAKRKAERQGIDQEP